MIQYNQLSIEGSLYIDIQVLDKPYYNDVYITGVRIDTANTYNTEYAYEQVTQELSKSMKVTLNVPVNNELFIITPIVSGCPSEDTPCGRDVVDIAYIYCDSKIKEDCLKYLGELGVDCTIPKSMIDYILRYIALDMSLLNEDYIQAVKYWGYLRNVNTKSNIKNCGCHG